jgi:hypothetical protein
VPLLDAINHFQFATDLSRQKEIQQAGVAFAWARNATSTISKEFVNLGEQLFCLALFQLIFGGNRGVDGWVGSDDLIEQLLEEFLAVRLAVAVIVFLHLGAVQVGKQHLGAEVAWGQCNGLLEIAL